MRPPNTCRPHMRYCAQIMANLCIKLEISIAFKMLLFCQDWYLAGVEFSCMKHPMSNATKHQEVLWLNCEVAWKVSTLQNKLDPTGSKRCQRSNKGLPLLSAMAKSPNPFKPRSGKWVRHDPLAERHMVPVWLPLPQRCRSESVWRRLGPHCSHAIIDPS